MERYEVNNGTITKYVLIGADPKRDGLLICKCYDDQGHHIATLWGKKNQAEIRSHIENSAA